ncbi:MAG: biopolymer transporter ExbD [Flavobacterium sp.]|uniref:ExbD/TolR family protein n=1 Tax=Flavobacterium sp. TaxID=239 RepID=UPI001B25652E|nr:biopolymer transporter ExbD [Flavobacterium sp.]MBO9584540.1 biopolymer transporter ExbD [Flavobacterium sp.]
MKNLAQKVRDKKSNSGVDLTAMVSISFLLVAFFMIASELSLPKKNLYLPEKYACIENIGCVKVGQLFTILLDKNGKVITYSGLLEFPMEKPKEFKFQENEIRQEVFRKKKEVRDYMISEGRPMSGVVVIIKPSKHSNYGSLVNIVDEMKIAKIENYSIVDDFTVEESKLLASN